MGLEGISACGRSDFLDGQKVTKEPLRGCGHGDRALRDAAGGSPHAPLPLRTPITGDEGPVLTAWQLHPARNGQRSLHPLPAHWGLAWAENDGLCPRGVRLAWHLPPGGAVGWGTEAFCVRTTAGGAGRKVLRLTDTPATSALRAIGSGASQKPPLKREVARRSRDGGFLPPSFSTAPAGGEKPPVTA